MKPYNNNPNLFKHRFMVLNVYPGGYPEGHIIEATLVYNEFKPIDNFLGPEVKDLSAFPRLFRQMKWYEMRTVETMPVFVKKISSEGYHRPNDILLGGWEIKISVKRQVTFCFIIMGASNKPKHTYTADEVFPATDEEINEAEKNNKIWQ